MMASSSIQINSGLRIIIDIFEIITEEATLKPTWWNSPTWYTICRQSIRCCICLHRMGGACNAGYTILPTICKSTGLCMMNGRLRDDNSIGNIWHHT